jgi:hypothetical protein
MPMRNVSNRGGNVIGKFPSIKMGRMIAFESLLERDFIYLLDYEWPVRWFEEQPLTINYHHQGKVLCYTPDFHVVEEGGDVLVECKPVKLVQTEENRRKFAAACEWCAQRGWEFRIVTERQVHGGFRLQNVKLLTRYARQTVNPAVRGGIYALLHHAQAPMTIDDVAGAISSGGPGAIMASILHMAFHHEVFVPLDDAPLSGKALVCLPTQTRKER